MNNLDNYDASGSQYSNEDRRAALACYVIHGNYTKCGRMLNIPHNTLSQWGKQEWWLNSIDQVRLEKQDEVDAGYQKIIDMAIESVTTRFKLGDEIVGARGETFHRAVSARDSMTIGAIAQDKQRVLRNLPVSITTSVTSDKLLKLQQSFEALAQAKTIEIEGEVIEHEPKKEAKG